MASLPIDRGNFEHDADVASARVNQYFESRHAALKAEVERILSEDIPVEYTPEQNARFEAFVRRMEERKPLALGPHPTAEEMIREDRDR
jgi:hypothetical protein